MMPHYQLDVRGKAVNTLTLDFQTIIERRRTEYPETNLYYTNPEVLAALEIIRSSILTDAVLNEQENRTK